MKKKLLIIASMLILVIAFAGCSKKDAKEYNIDDLLVKYTKVKKGIEKETQYWSDDEKKGDKYVKLVKKYAEKNGFELNEKILVKGKVNSVMAGGVFLSTNSKDSDSLMCTFKSFKLPSYTALLEPDKNSTVEGILFETYKDKDGTNGVHENLSKCKIKSPNLNETEFEDNIEDIVLSENYQDRIMGTVTSVVKIPASEDERQEVLDSADSSISGESDFASAYRYASHTISFDLGNDKNLICFVDESFCNLPEIGDKISFIGNHFTYQDDEWVEAIYSPIYNFSNKK